MREDFTCQKLWTKVVRAMSYGTYNIIPWSIADRAWPATGQNDVVQIARVVSGQPVELVMSTVDRVRIIVFSLAPLSDSLGFSGIGSRRRALPAHR